MHNDLWLCDLGRAFFKNKSLQNVEQINYVHLTSTRNEEWAERVASNMAHFTESHVASLYDKSAKNDWSDAQLIILNWTLFKKLKCSYQILIVQKWLFDHLSKYFETSVSHLLTKFKMTLFKSNCRGFLSGIIAHCTYETFGP